MEAALFLIFGEKSKIMLPPIEKLIHTLCLNVQNATGLLAFFKNHFHDKALNKNKNHLSNYQIIVPLRAI